MSKAAFLRELTEAMAERAAPAAERKTIRAYHGSPHDFDQFSLDKIGTGEGAQAYGHGLYFADNEEIARYYRDALSRDVSYDGQPVAKAHPMDNPMAGAIHAVASRVREGADPREAIAEQAAMWQGYADKMVGFSKGKPELEALIPQRTKGFLDIVDSINRLDPDKFRKNPGSMYEVEINADPNTFLDWDKPLSEQPPAVQDALQKGWLAHPSTDANRTGSSIYDNLRRAEYGNTSSPDKAAKALKEAGIPGIKYLDAGSRGAGEGTRNYVVFDDKLISIIRKYGIAGASALLGYNILDGIDPAQAAELRAIEAEGDEPAFAEGGGVDTDGEESWLDSLYTYGRNAADKATYGTAKYAAAAGDYGYDTLMDALGYENQADFDRSLAEQVYALKEGEEKQPLAAGLGDITGYVAPYLAVGPAQGALSSLGQISDYGGKVSKTGSLLGRAFGFAQGGRVRC